MREVVLDAIDAYVSAKEIELERLLNPPAKTATKSATKPTVRKRTNKKPTTKKEKVIVA